MTDQRMQRRDTGGMAIGLHVLRLRESWPLVLVAIGISLVWKETRTRARVE